jgi:hypothetical protein
MVKEGCMSESTLFANGFEDAFLGIGHHFNRELAVYDYAKCIEILMERDGMDEEEAEEFMSFNVTGAWVGEYTPIFLVKVSYENAHNSAIHAGDGDHPEPGPDWAQET